MTGFQQRFLVMVASVAGAVGWLCYCVRNGTPQEADRGGDIGMAVTLAFLFVSQGTRLALFNTTRRAEIVRDALKGQAAQPVTALQEQITDLATAIAADGDQVQRGNAFLVLATVLNAVISVWGDKIAAVF